MLRAGIVVWAICACVGGTGWWLKSSANSKDYRTVPPGMPSIEELHAKARVHGLPIQEIKDLY